MHPETCVLSPHAKPWVPARSDEHFVSSEQQGSASDAWQNPDTLKELKLLKRLCRSLAARRTLFRVPDACRSISSCPAHSETTTCGASGFVDFLLAPLNGNSASHARPRKGKALDPCWRWEGKREHLCYANNTPAGQFDQHFVGEQPLRFDVESGHGHRNLHFSIDPLEISDFKRTAAFDIDVSRARHEQNIVRRFAPDYSMCTSMK